MVSPKANRKIPWYLILVFLLLASSVGVAGYSYYQQQVEKAQKTLNEDLSAIVNLKIDQIANWRKKRLEEGIAIQGNHAMASLASQWLSAPTPALQAKVQSWLLSLSKTYDDPSVTLLDRKGHPRLTASGRGKDDDDYRSFAERAARTHEPVLADFHPVEGSDQVVLDLLIPLLVPQGQEIQAAGVLVLGIDPRKSLFPLIQLWPTASHSAECLLIRWDGLDALILNELRHQKNTALKLREPIKDPRLALASAGYRGQGLIAGTDYRNIRVLAVMRKIPDSPWFLVAKVDAKEALSFTHTLTSMILALILVIIACAGAGVYLLWRRQVDQLFRKQYEDELNRQALQQHYEYLIKFANDIILLMDPQWKIIEANDRAAECYGYTRDEFLRLNFRDLQTPEAWSYLETQRKKMAEPSGLLLETVHRRRDGSLFPVEISARVMDVEEKSFYQTITRDITERKRTEETLRHAHDELEQRVKERTQDLQSLAEQIQMKEKQQRALLDNIPESTWLKDREGRYIAANEAFSRGIGFLPEELVGKTDLEIWPGDLAKGIRQDDLDVMTAGKMKRVEEEISPKEGETWWLEIIKNPITNDKAEVVGIVGIARNITERKRAEVVLRRSHEELEGLVRERTEELVHTNRLLLEAKATAEAASRGKSEFLASMSHEIRTPMNAIIGMADLLWETPLSTEQRQYVGIFKNAGDTLLNIINDILDISKVEAGQLTLENVEFPLNDLVEKACEVMAIRAHKKGVELAFHLQPDLPQRVKGDPTRLKQVITNLVGNAVKFTEQGEVVLEVRKMPPGQLPGKDPDGRGCLLQFAIRDTGIGISQDKLDLIFERFTQADSSTTRKYGGTGLGLTISKQLVELMGGQIRVESQQGKGSTFFFELSLETGTGAREKPPAPAPNLQGMRTLVIDDNETSRRILKETLSRWGALVTEAADGPRGLAILAEAKESGQPFRILFLDGRMPSMDGFEVAERMKGSPGLAGIVVMMLTSDNRGSDIVRVKDIGISSYLVKPIKRAELEAAVKAVVGQAMAAEHVPSALQRGKPEDKRALRILLVEDSEDNRKLIKAYLKNTSHAIDVAENGLEAVNHYKASFYDLVLMDMQMPIKDGYTATREIREWEKLQERRTPILALTAYALKDDAQKSLDAGCDAHLSKPIRKAELMAAIDKFANSSPSGAP